MIWSQESYEGTNSFDPALCDSCIRALSESPPGENMIKVKEEGKPTSETKAEVSEHHNDNSSSQDQLSKEDADVLVQILRNKCKSYQNKYQNKLKEKRKNEARLRSKLFRSKKHLDKLKHQVEASEHHIEKSSSEDKLSKEVADMLLQTLRNKCKSYQNKLEEKRKNELMEQRKAEQELKEKQRRDSLARQESLLKQESLKKEQDEIKRRQEAKK